MSRDRPSDVADAPEAGREAPGASGRVLSIRGWDQPLGCPSCRGEQIVQVDVVECAYPVRGVRRPWGYVVVDVSASSLDPSATHAEFFRCLGCEHEWPVGVGTRFIDTEEVDQGRLER